MFYVPTHTYLCSYLCVAFLSTCVPSVICNLIEQIRVAMVSFNAQKGKGGGGRRCYGTVYWVFRPTGKHKEAEREASVNWTGLYGGAV